MLICAFVIIVVLTWILIAMNVRGIVRQYDKDRNAIRLYSYLVLLLIMGSSIIGVSSAVVQRVIDAETYLKSDQGSPAVHYPSR